ncbi:MAG: hypothetical protein A2015_02420 [Spirochaetes bacterium GWF1_31_7]|nr:MAG: hypothetical protein A2Y30_06265 [Spirochaetes bacterium GWE1_32_154]OHD50711.1 MAG: hypothetical protein A2Y29_09190 [Spirochaetes bacterium GWE2_31_10]OHD50767.1 MAG: hypothetical protein A2015_02420 [Spirochaetes bacterium GWF1_31_7]OHD73659.1 MAG: hypothetical protein A2355_11410 [Spirochaetes bacterium RIFOXYB1_FULL_32_8]HBI38008.1 hypothetical protein [Spirochaetia bacterium]
MYKVLYITEKNNSIIKDLQSEIEKILNIQLDLIQIINSDDIYDNLLSENQPAIVIFDETENNTIDIVKNLKKDESFSYLPILLLSDKYDYSNNFSCGIDAVVRKNISGEELAHQISTLIKYKIRIDSLNKNFSEMSERNATKSIQLDLIKKFIPLTVWDKCEDLANHQNMIIPEEEKELSFIYADLESFTSMSENLTPTEVINTLNLIFDIVTQIVYQNYGDIDKFIGDAFLAIFNSPDMALLSGIMIQSELERINNERISKKMFPLKLRMGIHYGRVVRGSVGGTLRYDNTLIGDPINTTQRLEGMSPSGGILASKNIIQKIASCTFENARFDKYFLKGKNKEIEAILLFDYYKSHQDIMETLFKYRKFVEPETLN